MLSDIIYKGRALRIAVGIILISVLVLGCVGEKVSSNTSDVKATPQITPNSTTPKVTQQATTIATYTPTPTPNKTAMPKLTPTATIPLTQGVLNTGTYGGIYDLGSGYTLVINTISTEPNECPTGCSWVELKKNGSSLDNNFIYVDKPVILGKIISITLKSVEPNKNWGLNKMQFIYNFI